MSTSWDDFPPVQDPIAPTGWDAFPAVETSAPSGFAALMSQDAIAPPEPEKDFWDTGDVFSGIWDAVKGLGVTAPAAFYQLTEGMERPDQYSESAKNAFAEAEKYALEMQAKTEANRKAGTSSSAGESIREAGQSLGFTAASLGAAAVAGTANAAAWSAAGAAGGAAAGLPAGGVGAAPGAAVGAAGGGVAGFVTGAVASGLASGAAAWRMAGASFLNEAFQNMEKESLATEGRQMTEQEKADAYEELLPIAKNTALWEAGPEAVSSAVTLGAGKLIFGKGIVKTLKGWGLEKAAAVAVKPGGKLAIRVGAGLANIGTELGTETLTQVEQAADQLKAQAVSNGQNPDSIVADWSAKGVTAAFQEVMPQTLAMLGLMGGGGVAVKTAAKAADAGLRMAGLRQTADVVNELDAAPLPAALPSVISPLDESGAPVAPELPAEPIPADKTGDELGAVVFGKAPRNTAWREDLTPDEFILEPNPDHPDQLAVYQQRDPKDKATKVLTTRAYNQKTGVFEELAVGAKLKDAPRIKPTPIPSTQQQAPASAPAAPPAVPKGDGIERGIFRGVVSSAVTRLKAKFPSLADSIEVNEDESFDSGGGKVENGVFSFSVKDVEEDLRDIPVKDHEARIDAVADEEVHHSAQNSLASKAGKKLQDYFKPLAKSFTDKQASLFSSVYGVSFEFLSDANKAIESTRILMQLLSGGATTDQTHSLRRGQAGGQATISRNEAVAALKKMLDNNEFSLDVMDAVNGALEIYSSLHSASAGSAKPPQTPAAGSAAAASLSPQAPSVVEPVVTASPDVITPTTQSNGQEKDQGRKSDAEGQVLIPNPEEGGSVDPLSPKSVASTKPIKVGDAIAGRVASVPDADLSPIVSGAQASTDPLLKPYKVADGTVDAKRLVAEAIVNKSGARAALKAIGVTPEVREAVQKAVEASREHGLADDAKGAADALLEATALEYGTGPLATSSSPAPVSAPAAELGRVHLSEAQFEENVVRGQQGARAIDNRAFKVGQVVTVGSNDGTKVKAVYRVAAVSQNKNGTARHHLVGMAIKGEKSLDLLVERTGLFQPNARVLNASSNAASAAMRVIVTDKLKADRGMISRHVRDAIKAQFASLFGQSFADTVLFDLSGEAAPMHFNHRGDKQVHVNTGYYVDELIKAAGKVDPSNSQALEFVARDFAGEIANTALEEMSHRHSVDVLSDNEAASAAQEIFDLGTNVARAELARAIRWRNGLQRSSEAEALAAFESMPEPEKAAVFHELLASLYARSRTGTDVASARHHAARYLSELVKDAPKDKGSTLLGRLIEMANRYFEAMREFLAAQKTIAALPPRVAEYLNVLDSALKQDGALIPDTYDVAAETAKGLSGELRFMNRLAQAQPKLASAQKALRDVIGRVREKHGDAAVPVTLDANGALKVDPAFMADWEDELDPILDELNSSLRADQAVRFMGVARDLELVLRHLNSGQRPTRVEKNRRGEMDVVADVLPMMQEALRTVENASSLSPDEFIKHVDTAMQALGQAPFIVEGHQKRSDDLMDMVARHGHTSAHRGLVARYRAARDRWTEISQLPGALTASPQDAVDTSRTLVAADNTEANRQRLADQLATYPADVSIEEFESVRADAMNLPALIEEELNRISRDVDENGKPTLPAGVVLRDKPRRDALYEEALSAHRRNQQAFEQIRSTAALLNRFVHHPEQISTALRQAIPDAQPVIDALQRAAHLGAASRRLADFREEFDFLVLGGRPPGRRSRVWTNINLAQGSQQAVLMPISTGRLAFTFGADMLETPEDALLAKPNEFAGTMSAFAEHGTFSLRYDASDAHALEGETFTKDADGRITFSDPSVVARIIPVMAAEIADGAVAASRMLGIEPNSFPVDDEGVPLSAFERMEPMLSNARVFTEQAVASLQESRWRNHLAVSEEALATNGFSIAIRYDDSGAPRIIRPQEIIPMPDMTAMDFEMEGPDKFWQIIDSGVLANLLASNFSFAQAHGENAVGRSTPLLSHEGGLTPAGLAWQVTQPKLIELLALTKVLTLTKGPRENQANVDVQQALLDSLALTPEEVSFYQASEALEDRSQMTAEMAMARDKSARHSALVRAYRSLAPGLESAMRGNTPVTHGDIAGRAWDLHRNTKTANSIYRDSFFMAASRNKLAALDESTQDIPVNVRELRNAAFEATLRSKMSKFTKDGTFFSLLLPQRASKYIEDYAWVSNLAPEKVLVESGDGFKLVSMGGDINSADAMDEDDMVYGQKEALLKAQQRIAARMDTWRGASLMAIFGGDVDKVLGAVNSPEFSGIETNLQGEPSRMYHTDKLNGWILDQLEEFHQEELTRGVVSSDKESFDGAIRGLGERHSASKDVVASLLNTGGSVEMLHQTAPRLDPETFTADAHTLTTAIGAMIPGLAIVQGRASWELSQDRGALVDVAQAELNLDRLPGYTPGQEVKGDQSRIPTIHFISDAQAPTLVMPYGGGTAVTEQDAREALVDMLEWMGAHGGVDLTGQAQRIVDVLRGNQAPRQDLIETIRVQYQYTLQQRGQSWGEKEDAYIAALSHAWTDVMDLGARKAAGMIRDAADGWFSGVRDGAAPDPKSSARIIALALSDPSARKALVLSMRAAPVVADETSPSQAALRGDLVDAYRLPGFFEAVIAEQIADLQNTFIPKGLDGIALSPEDEGFVEAAALEVIKALEEEANGIPSLVDSSASAREKLASIFASPVSMQQAEWAGELMHSILNQLDPARGSGFKLPSGLLPDVKPMTKRLSEFEARQLLASVNPDIISHTLASRTERTRLAWNGGGMSAMPSVNELMSAVGESADALRDLANEAKIQLLNDRSEDQNFNHKTFSFTDALDIQGFRYSKWHNARVLKGMIGNAELMANTGLDAGLVLPAWQDASPDQYRVHLNTNFEALLSAASDAGVLRHVPDPDFSDGRTIDELTLARRTFQRENAAHQEWMDGMRADMLEEWENTKRLKESLADIEALRDELVSKPTRAAYLDTLKRSGNLSIADLKPLVDTVFGDHEALLAAMSSEMVGQYLDGVEGYETSLLARRLVSPYEKPDPNPWLKASFAPSVQSSPSTPFSRFFDDLAQQAADANQTLLERAGELRTAILVERAAYDKAAPRAADADGVPYLVNPEEFQVAMDGFRQRLSQLAGAIARHKAGDSAAFLRQRKADVAAGSLRQATERFSSDGIDLWHMANEHLESLRPIIHQLDSLPSTIADLESQLDTLAMFGDDKLGDLDQIRTRLDTAKTNLSKAQGAFQANVEAASEYANRRVPSLIRRGEFRLSDPTSPARFRDVLRKLTEGREGLFDLTHQALAHEAVKEAQNLDITDLRSIDFTRLSPDRRVLIPRVVQAKLVAAIQRGGSREQMVSRVSNVLAAQVLPGEQAARAATTRLEREISRKLALPGKGNAASVMQVFVLSSELDSFDAIDSLTRRDIVTRLTSELLSNQIEMSDAEIRRRMNMMAKEEAGYARRTHDFWAHRDNKPSALRLNGTPDENAVAARWLRQLGARWSERYMSLREDSRMIDGYESAMEAASLTDEQMVELGAEAMEIATGRSWKVVDNVVMPVLGEQFISEQEERAKMDAHAKRRGYQSWDHFVQTDAAERALYQQYRRGGSMIYGKDGFTYDPNFPIDKPLHGVKLPQGGELAVARNASVDAEVAAIMAKLDFGGFLGATSPSALRQQKAEAAKLYNPALDQLVQLRERTAKRIEQLVTAYDSGVLQGHQGVIHDGEIREQDTLHTEVGVLLDALRRGPSESDMATFDTISNNVDALLQMSERLADMADAFIPGEVFSNQLVKALLNHDPLVRSTFARNAVGREYAFETLGILDRGATNVGGRNGFTASNDAYARLFDAESSKLKELSELKGSEAVNSRGKFYDAAAGRMFQAIAGYLRGGSYQDRAEAMLRGFDQADNGYAQAQAEAAASRTKNFLFSPTYKMLEQQRVYESLRDSFKPILQGLADGSYAGSEEDAILEMEALLSPQGKRWGRFLNATFSHLQEAYVAQARMSGADLGVMKQHGPVSFHWEVFHREYSPANPEPSLTDSLRLDRAPWLTGPTRNPKKGEIIMLDVDGIQAAQTQARDMLFRMNVQPAYATFKKAVGTAEHVGRTLQAGERGWLERLAIQKYGDNSLDAQSMARALALTGQDVLHRDMANQLPANRAMDGMQKFQQIGATKALVSLSQMWRQTGPGMVFYSLTYGGKENFNFPKWYGRYLFDKLGGAFSRIGKGPGTNVVAPSFSHNVDAMVEKHAPNDYKRTFDGQKNFYDNLSRLRPSKELRAKGALTGKHRPIADALSYVPREAAYWTMKTADWMLHTVLAKAESTLVRSIWAFEMTKGLNRLRTERGESPLTVDEVMNPANGHERDFSSEMLSRASRAVTDLMAVSDQGKKSRLFQQADTVTVEVARGMLVTFANHQIHMSGNSWAAWKMLRHGDAASRREGARLIGTSLGQNVMFQLFRYETMGLLLAGVLAALFDWDEEEERNFYGSLHGISPNADEDTARAALMRWGSLLMGGSNAPIGYNDRDMTWDDDERAKDLKGLALRSSKELVNQTPFAGIGLLASTTLGSSLSEWALKNTVMELVPGDLGYYERAGLVIPERWGGSGEGPQSESGLERLAYNASKVFMNDISSRSTLTGGITSLLDPMIQISNSPEPVGALDASLVWLSQFPAMPRELRRKMQKPFLDNTGANIWAGSWEAR